MNAVINPFAVYTEMIHFFWIHEWLLIQKIQNIFLLKPKHDLSEAYILVGCEGNIREIEEKKDTLNKWCFPTCNISRMNLTLKYCPGFWHISSPNDTAIINLTLLYSKTTVQDLFFLILMASMLSDLQSISR